MDLDDGYTRSSILMPQKRNPYALSIVRGASGVVIGRLTGFLAVAKRPVRAQRQSDLRLRRGAAGTGPVDPRHAADGGGGSHAPRQRRSDGRRKLDGGYTQATDLCEFIVQACGVDYAAAYVVVGKTVREASRRGIAGRDITGAMLDEVHERRPDRPGD